MNHTHTALRLSVLILATAVPLTVWANGQSPEFIQSYATLLGHPVHPVLVVFPIGLFIASLVSDIIYAVRKDAFWHRMAYYLIWGGLIGGLAAAIPGFLDYFLAVPSTSHAYGVATTHWILNLTLLGLFGINLAYRTKVDTSSGRPFALATALSVVAVGVMMVSGWYGGHLVYEHRVGVAPSVHSHTGQPQSSATSDDENEDHDHSGHQH